jgi:hypothetical protein
MDVELVKRIETGLNGWLLLAGKLRNTVLMLASSHAAAKTQCFSGSFHVCGNC